MSYRQYINDEVADAKRAARRARSIITAEELMQPNRYLKMARARKLAAQIREHLAAGGSVTIYGGPRSHTYRGPEQAHMFKAERWYVIIDEGNFKASLEHSFVIFDDVIVERHAPLPYVVRAMTASGYNRATARPSKPPLLRLGTPPSLHMFERGLIYRRRVRDDRGRQNSKRPPQRKKPLVLSGFRRG